MTRSSVTMIMAAGLAALISMPCQGKDRVHLLSTNPFSPPDQIDESATGQTQQTRTNGGNTLELRGTMQAGRNSLANIGGLILAIGQSVEGYKVVAVEDRKVILEKAGARKELTVND